MVFVVLFFSFNANSTHTLLWPSWCCSLYSLRSTMRDKTALATSLSKVERELVAVAASLENECRY